MNMFRTYVASCLLLMCNAVFAQTFTVDGVNYEVLDGENRVQIKGTEGTPAGHWVVPASVTHEGTEYSVVAIADFAFAECYNVTGIEFPNTLERIGIEAFYNCTSLNFIAFPTEHMEEIGARAFAKCSNLWAVELPKSVRNIGNDVFNNCYNLLSVVLPETVSGEISVGVFRGCSFLKWVTMPSYVTRNIPASIFEGCYNLEFLYFLNPDASRCSQFYADLAKTVIEYVKIIVPDGAVDDYAKYWSEWPVYSNSVHILNDVTIPETIEQLYSLLRFSYDLDFSDHGLLTSPDQITTNKLEPTEGSIAALLDNNKETYFHSTWSVANESLDNYHYLEVDLEKAVKEITLFYARRSHNTVSSPEVIHVYATNDPNGEWMDMGRDTCNLYSYCFTDESWATVWYPSWMQGCATGSQTVIEMDDAYRYVRFEVEKSYAPNAGVQNLNNIYFTLSELAIRESFNGYKIDLDAILTPQGTSDMFTDVWNIEEASWNYEGTEVDVEILNMWIDRIQEGIATGVDQVTVRPATVPAGVYSISGKLVKKQSENLNDLPKGIYIVNGKKVVK